MAEMKLRCGTIVLVDSDDRKRFTGLAWFITAQGYVARKTTINKQHGCTVFMHREVVKEHKGSGRHIDHINGDVRDNRSENLRVATCIENHRNSRKRKSTTRSQYKGVTWNNRSGKWQSQITIKPGTRTYLGVFECEHEAGHAYNRAAVANFGEFACLNPVGEPTR